MKKIYEMIQKILSLEGSLFVYSLSFSLLLTIAPAITLFVVSFEWLHFDVELIRVYALQFLPKELIEPFIDFLLNKNVSTRIASFISMGISLYMASKSVYSFLMIAASQEEINYPKWSLRLYSIFEFVLIYLYVIFSIVLVTLLKRFHVPFISLLTIGLLFLGFYIFYYLCTFKVRGRYYALPGALFSMAAIYGVGLLFFQIVNHFMNYDTVYGPLASLMILYLSVLVISYIIYIGYILNNCFISEKNDTIRKNFYFQFSKKLEDQITSKMGGKK